MTQPLLQVSNLKKYFPIHSGVFLRQSGNVYAVDDISFHVNAGETLGIVGESGCGKSTVGKTILRLHEPTAGQITYQGRDICELGQKEMVSLRREMQIIFQDPFASLNSRHTIGTILQEPYVIHKIGTEQERRKWVEELLDKVGLPQDSYHRYPHEFSGGQRQRIGIARAIALKPKLIVCDEPVSALDVSVQSQVINLLLDLQQDMGLSLIFIAHDLAVVRHVSDRVVVMYLGKIVESASAEEIYQNPQHPYTRSLIDAIPVADPKREKNKHRLSGEVPSPIDPPAGCYFHTRCPQCFERCKVEMPLLQECGSSHEAACHLLDK